MFTLEFDEFMFELKAGTLKHVGGSTKSATAKLYDVESVEVRRFGNDRVKVSCVDDGDNTVEIALDEDEARAVARGLEDLDDE